MSGRDALRVMHLIGQLGRGGTEHQLDLTLRHLDASRVRSEVVVFNPSPHEVFDGSLRSAGIAVHHVPESIRSPVARALWLRSLLASRRVELVHSWTVHDNPYAAISGRLAGCRVHWGSLRGAPDSHGMRQLPRLLRWLSLRANQRLVVNTPRLAQRLEEMGYDRSRTILLPNCVDIGTGRPSPDRVPDLPFPAGTRILGAVGNLRWVKNHELFVAALARVLPDRPDTAAVIVGQTLPGEPEIAARLEARIGAAGLADRVLLLGFRNDVPALLRRFAALCLTSRTEGTPNVLLEAMAAGCPVVATDVGGVPDLIEHERTGLLAESDNVDEVADALIRILDDEELAAGLTAAAEAHVRRVHSCEAVAARLASEYERALEGRRARS